MNLRKGSLEYYQLLSKDYSDIITVQRDYDIPSRLTIICKENYNIGDVLSFTEKLEYCIDYEIIQVKKEDIMLSIEEDLKEVDVLIAENKRLQEKYPKYKFGLELGLVSLLELRKEMERALDNQKKAQKIIGEHLKYG